jgi:hypothetical protein
MSSLIYDVEVKIFKIAMDKNNPNDKSIIF